MGVYSASVGESAQNDALRSTLKDLRNILTETATGSQVNLTHSTQIARSGYKTGRLGRRDSDSLANHDLVATQVIDFLDATNGRGITARKVR
ncbi:hypothetical protein RE428_16890 [Marinobacter nanhaiticus D15-8W]|nr:hypothetical protein RE428_16890 [Marinobacter nanhaiticus D15-8W]